MHLTFGVGRGAGAVRGVQVQLAGAGGTVWRAGDGVGVGLVGGVQDERRLGREHGGGDERWRAGWVSDGERVIRWTDVIERGRGQ